MSVSMSLSLYQSTSDTRDLRPTAISLASGPGRAIIDIAIITLNIAKLSVAPLVLLSPLKI